MFDTMTVTKAAGAVLGAFLIFLLGKWTAEVLYHVGGHGEPAYVIETGESDAPSEETVELSLADLLAQADVDKGEKVFKKCAACHKLEDGANGTGPSLYGVVGRPVAAIAGFGYSDPMAAHGGDWTPEVLSEFLVKPADAVPGTKMSFAGLPKAEDRANLIAFLNTNSAAPIEFAATDAPSETVAAAEPAATEAPATTETPAEPVATEAPAATETPAQPAATETPTEPTTAEPTATETPAATEPASADTAAMAGDPEKGAKVFKKCQACHKTEEGKNGVGPYLHGVVGRPIASIDGFKFSAALADKGGDWTLENLDAFLTKPSEFAKGTKMTFAGLSKQEDRDDVIAYLNSLN